MKMKMNKIITIVGLVFCVSSLNAYASECVGYESCPRHIVKLKKDARHGALNAQLLLGAFYNEGKYLDVHFIGIGER